MSSKSTTFSADNSLLSSIKAYCSSNKIKFSVFIQEALKEKISRLEESGELEQDSKQVIEELTKDMSLDDIVQAIKNFKELEKV